MSVFYFVVSNNLLRRVRMFVYIIFVDFDSFLSMIIYEVLYTLP